MATPRRGRPADDVVRLLRRGTWWITQLTRELRDGGRHIDARGRHRLAPGLPHLPEDPARRGRRAGDPVRGDVVEQPIECVCLAQVAVAPLPKLLHDPAGETGGGILAGIYE